MKHKKTQLILIVIAVIIVIVGILSMIYINIFSSEAKYKKSVSLGYQLLQKKDFMQAVEAFTDALEIDDTNVNVMLGLGEAYYGLNDLEEAETILLRAIKADDGSVTAYEKLAMVYQQSEKPEKATAILETGYKKTKNQKLDQKVDVPEMKEEKAKEKITAVNFQVVTDYKYEAQGPDGLKFSVDVPKVIGSKNAEKINLQLEKKRSVLEQGIEEAKAGTFEIMKQKDLVLWVDSYDVFENNKMYALVIKSEVGLKESHIDTTYSVYYYDALADKVLSKEEYAEKFGYSPEQIVASYNSNLDVEMQGNKADDISNADFYFDNNGELIILFY